MNKVNETRADEGPEIGGGVMHSKGHRTPQCSEQTSSKLILSKILQFYNYTVPNRPGLNLHRTKQTGSKLIKLNEMTCSVLISIACIFYMKGDD